MIRTLPGEKMLEAKAQLAHGEFIKWVKQNFKFGIRSSQIYMALAARETMGSEIRTAIRISEATCFTMSTARPAPVARANDVSAAAFCPQGQTTAPNRALCSGWWEARGSPQAVFEVRRLNPRNSR
jgi:hypothetical protein